MIHNNEGMNPTVAVALITAASTLTAAALTGVLATWVNARQLRHQYRLAREQRAEDRADRLRQLRREAYQHLLSKADAAYRLLDEGWLAAPSTERPDWADGFAARRTLDEAVIRVQLEGPPEVAQQAAALVRSVGREFQLYRSVRDAAATSTQSAAELDSGRAEAIRERSRANSAFIETARHALDGPAAQSAPRIPATDRPALRTSEAAGEPPPTG